MAKKENKTKRFEAQNLAKRIKKSLADIKEKTACYQKLYLKQESLPNKGNLTQISINY